MRHPTPILTSFDRDLLLDLRFGLSDSRKDVRAVAESTRYMVGLGLLIRTRRPGHQPLRVTDAGRRASVGV